MKTVYGDLLDLAVRGDFDVIIHGCNCQCAMGAGIARSIKAKFPEAYAADRDTKKADRSKLGTFSCAMGRRGDTEFTVVNAYTQFHWRGKGVLADYEAIRTAMAGVRRRFTGKRIGYPRIGAGLAGGEWSIISAIINEELDGEDHTLVEYQAG